MGIVARHRTLDVAYAKAALRAVDKLFERQPGGRGREMSEADRYMALPYTVEVARDEHRRDAFHVARVVELEGCIAQGRTEAEARSELRDAQRLFIETMLDNGVPVPAPRP